MSALDGTWAKGYGVLNDGSPGHAGSGQVIAIAGRKANHDVMDGGDGWDTLTGTGFDDVIVLDDRFSPTALSGPRFMNIELIRRRWRKRHHRPYQPDLRLWRRHPGWRRRKGRVVGRQRQ
jgi:Ca2+-binding RTX toxin-like protein